MTTTGADPYAFWLAGRRATGEDTFDVTSAWDGALVGRVAVPTEEQVDQAVAAAAAARDAFAATPAHVRAAALDHVAKRLAERAEELARLITAENGKPLKWARGEVGRAVSVFRWAAEEARRFNSGEAQRLDTDPGGVGRLALTRRFTRGPVLGIAPFNFPLNLVAHKVAPALAVGAPDHRQARARHPAVRAGPRRAAGRDRGAARGRVERPDRCRTTGWPRSCRTRGCR